MLFLGLKLAILFSQFTGKSALFCNAGTKHDLLYMRKALRSSQLAPGQREGAILSKISYLWLTQDRSGGGSGFDSGGHEAGKSIAS
jgi:hypothetical protein